MIRGYYWRDTIRDTFRTILEQSWPRLAEYRVVPLLPVSTMALDEGEIAKSGGVPKFTLSRDDKRAFEHNSEEHLARVTTKACIMLMREGYEIRNAWVVGEEKEARLIQSYKEFIETFGDPEDNGSKKK